jgi:hypothetical protein
MPQTWPAAHPCSKENGKIRLSDQQTQLQRCWEQLAQSSDLPDLAGPGQRAESIRPVTQATLLAMLTFATASY